MQIADIHGDGARWALDALDVTVRVRAARPDGAPVFVGIASQADVEGFLAQTAHEVITDVHGGRSYDSIRRGGRALPGAPADAHFWAASTVGNGRQSLIWKPGTGRWAIVVMNADGSAR